MKGKYVDALNLRFKRPEAKIQHNVIKKLILRGWYCLDTHGNAYQSGFPDLFVCHKRWGSRWIEIKHALRFTQAQLDVFTGFSSKGIGVWVLISEHEQEINKLQGPANWAYYLNTSRGIDLNDRIKRIKKTGPEAVIQDAIIDQMTKKCGCGDTCNKHICNNWFCIETFGSMYQYGFPDIYACHKVYGARWIECKNPAGYRFTPAQMDVFPRFSAEGVGIHILTAVNQIPLIHGPANWYSYLKG